MNQARSKRSLVLIGDELVAVLVKLDEAQGENEGKWFVAAAFNHLETIAERVFDTIDEVRHWMGLQDEQ